MHTTVYAAVFLGCAENLKRNAELPVLELSLFDFPLLGMPLLELLLLESPQLEFLMLS